ncbi:MAG TPA: MarR family winged helix-turn-helix transcriptional regulator [Burkholderiaceae bacterium]|nr:MarR family winged helix-turn-helix transcriptional regulator [Burkholderiaceae bacterium]
MHASDVQAAGPGGASRPAGCTCARLRRLTRRVSALYDRELAAVGLRVGQYSILMTLRHAAGAAGLGLGEAAERLDMDRTTLTRTLRPLADAGWVEIGVDPDDARQRRLRLTADGGARLDAARPHWRRAQLEVERLLGAAQVASLHDWLDATIPAFRPPGEDR